MTDEHVDTAVLEELVLVHTSIDPSLNQNEQVLILIGACLVNGIGQGSMITEAIHRLGYDKRYIGLILSKSAGADPKLHDWYRDNDGVYQLHDPVAPT